MKTYQNLLEQFGSGVMQNTGKECVHATLAGYPDRLTELEKAVESLAGQVDSLHVFLSEFDQVPEFLNRDKLFITRSQDFGVQGECGKYYWTDDLAGYHFICSDRLVYPADYVDTMIRKIELYQRKSVVGSGGFHLKEPYISLTASVHYLKETEFSDPDVRLPLVSDLALAYHSSTLRVSRHYFYQSALSACWFSIIVSESGTDYICIGHPAGWLRYSGDPGESMPGLTDESGYGDFLIRSYFLSDDRQEPVDEPVNINAFFDRIYVMNLDRRPDRWERTARIAQRHHLNLIRFPAVDGYREPFRSAWESYSRTAWQTLPAGIEPLADYKDKFLKYHHYAARVHFMESRLGRKAMQSPGAWGYALSYISILQEAIRSNYRRILILDDDILLHRNFNEEFEKHCMALPRNWKLIMLGAMQHQWEPWITLQTGMFYHCHGSSVASHAVGIDRKMFLPLLHYAMKLDLPIDEGAIFHIQNVYSQQCFIFTPNLAIQEMCESDISSSAMKPEDMDRWMKLFRWNPDDYDSASNEGLTSGI